MPAGRPTEYTPALLEKAKRYLPKTIKEDFLPQVAGMSLFLGVSRDTLYEWAKQYPEFSDIFEKVKAAQEAELIHKGLSGKYNPTITKLMLTKHGYSDKVETDVTSGGKPLGTFDDETKKNAKEAIGAFVAGDPRPGE